MQIAERLLLLDKAKDNRDLQLIEIEACKRDPIYFFNTYLYTEKNATFYSEWTPAEVPFNLFPFQEEYVKELWESIYEWSKPIEDRKPWVLTNVFIEKSRQMGISWVTAWIMVYWFVFYQHKYTLISRAEAEVDSPWDMDSLFEKMRFMLGNLPKWMLPEWYNKELWKDKTNRKMNISDINSSASITWKTANPWAWRWGTRNAVFMDEMAHMQFANQINKSVASNTPCRIFNSTPQWEFNEFYEMKKMAEKWDIKWLRYHWTDHPFYNDEWYNNRIKGMTSEAIAQELEINYTDSIKWRVYPEFKQEGIVLPYDHNKQMLVGIDNSHWWEDPHAVIIMQLNNKTHHWDIIDSIAMNWSVTDMAEFMACIPKFQMDDEQLDFQARYKTYNRQKATFITDPYDTYSTLNNTNVFKEYMKVWINVITPQKQNKQGKMIIPPKKEQIDITRRNIYKIRYNKSNEDFRAAIMNCRYPTIDHTRQTNRTTVSDLPVHDGTSHYRTALEYLASYIEFGLASKKVKKQLADTRPIRNYITWELEYPNKIWLNR